MESAKSTLRIATSPVHGDSGIESAKASTNPEMRFQVAFPHSPGFPKTMKFPNGLNPAASFPFVVTSKHPDSLGSPAKKSNPNPETQRHVALPPTETHIVCFHNLTCLLAGTIAKVEA